VFCEPPLVREPVFVPGVVPPVLLVPPLPPDEPDRPPIPLELRSNDSSSPMPSMSELEPEREPELPDEPLELEREPLAPEDELDPACPLWPLRFSRSLPCEPPVEPLDEPRCDPEEPCIPL